jgi:RGM family protein
LGEERSLAIEEIVPNEHIEIHLHYIDTTVVIRQVGGYFSVAVKMPAQIVNETLIMDEEQIQLVPAPVQLCSSGCPLNQIIPYKEIIANAKPVINSTKYKTVSENSMTKDFPRVILSKEVSLEKCRSAGLTDYFLDSCVFDLMSTGDNNFTTTSLYAMKDSVRLVPQLAARRQNRTDIDLRGVKSWSNRAMNSLVFHSILYQSHLNYIHRTSYILFVLLVHLVFHSAIFR